MESAKHPPNLLTCKVPGHEETEVVFLCTRPDCIRSRLVCPLCAVDDHDDHLASMIAITDVLAGRVNFKKWPKVDVVPPSARAMFKDLHGEDCELAKIAQNIEETFATAGVQLLARLEQVKNDLIEAVRQSFEDISFVKKAVDQELKLPELQKLISDLQKGHLDGDSAEELNRVFRKGVDQGKIKLLFETKGFERLDKIQRIANKGVDFVDFMLDSLETKLDLPSIVRKDISWLTGSKIFLNEGKGRDITTMGLKRPFSVKVRSNHLCRNYHCSRGVGITYKESTDPFVRDKWQCILSNDGFLEAKRQISSHLRLSNAAEVVEFTLDGNNQLNVIAGGRKIVSRTIPNLESYYITCFSECQSSLFEIQ